MCCVFRQGLRCSGRGLMSSVVCLEGVSCHVLCVWVGTEV